MNTKLKAKLLLGTFLISGLLAKMSNISLIYAGHGNGSTSSSSSSSSDSESESEILTQELPQSPTIGSHRLVRSDAMIMDKNGNVITADTSSSTEEKKQARGVVRPRPSSPKTLTHDIYKLSKVHKTDSKEFSLFAHTDKTHDGYHSDGELELTKSFGRKKALLGRDEAKSKVFTLTSKPEEKFAEDRPSNSSSSSDSHRPTRNGSKEEIKEYAQRTFDETMQSGAILGHEEEIEDLISKGALVNRVYSNGQTPLHIAVLSGNIKVIRAIIDVNFNPHARRANPNVNISPNLGARDKDGYTPLHLAAIHQTANVMKALLVPNCVTYIDDKDFQGRTAYRIAKESGKEDVALLLKNACANTEI